MKQHHKQNSLDFKVINSNNNDATPNKHQIISKTYRRKTNGTDSNPLLFLHNTPSTLNRYTNKKSLLKKSQGQSLEKKSQGKPSNQRSVEKIKSIYRPAYQSNTLGIKSKLLKINQILMIKAEEQVKDTIGKVYEANRQYNDLLKQWKRLQIYDEADDLIKRLVDNYTTLIQTLLYQTYTATLNSLNACQRQMEALKKQNQKLKSILQFQTHKSNVQMMELQSKLYEQFQKSQWATFIFNQLSLQPFDIDLFVRNSKIYSKAKHQYIRNDYFIRSKDNNDKQKNGFRDSSNLKQHYNQFIIKSFIQKEPSIVKI